MDNVSLFMLDKDTIGVFYELLDEAAMSDLKENDIAIGVVTLENKKPVPAGVIKASIEGRDIVLNWLYVREEMRRKGIGAMLVQKLAGSAAAVPGIEGMFAGYASDTAGLWELLDECGFVNFFPDGVAQFRMKLSDFGVFGKPCEWDQAVSLENISNMALKRLYVTIDESYENGDKISCGVGLPVNELEFMEESAAVVRDGEITTIILLMEEEYEDAIRIAWFYSKEQNPISMVSLFRHVLYRLNEKYDPDTEVVFGSLNGSSLKLIRKVFPGSKETPLVAAYALADEEYLAMYGRNSD